MAKKKDKLSDEELLKRLDEWEYYFIRFYSKEDKQAYQQIRDRILNKPKVSKEFVEKYETWIDHPSEQDDYPLTMKLTKQLLEEMLQEAGVEVEK